MFRIRRKLRRSQAGDGSSLGTLDAGWYLHPRTFGLRPNMAVNREPIGIIERASHDSLLARTPLCRRAKARYASGTKLKPQPTPAFVQPILKFLERCAYKLDVLLQEEKLDPKGAVADTTYSDKRRHSSQEISGILFILHGSLGPPKNIARCTASARVSLATSSLYAAFNELSADELRIKFPEIREQGYALDEGRLVAGISAFAMPILPQGRDVMAALAINMTSARMPPEGIPELVASLRREVNEIEASAESARSRRRPRLT